MNLDIDECDDPENRCSESRNEECRNTVGGYDCQCKAGYKNSTHEGRCIGKLTM